MSFRLGLFLSLCLFFSCCSVPPTSSLIKIKKNDKFGYIDQDGNVVLPLIFDAVRDSGDTLIAVKQGMIGGKEQTARGMWGFWSKEGKEIIPLQYDDARVFKEGLAAVKKDGLYGFIDVENRVVIDFGFADAHSFCDGLAAVKIEDKWGFVDKKGTIVIPAIYDDFNYFNHGLAVVCQAERKERKENFPERYLFANENGEYRRYGLIDKDGKVVLPIKYEYIGKFSEGFALINYKNKLGFIDTTGTIAVPIKYSAAKNFSEGLAAVCVKKDVKPENATKSKRRLTWSGLTDFEYGYINTQGEMIIAPQFSEAGRFENGKAWVAFGMRTLFRAGSSKTEKEINPHGYHTNLIDRSGNLQFSENANVMRYNCEILVVSEGGRRFLHQDGQKTEIPPYFQQFEYAGDGYFFVIEKESQRKFLYRNGIMHKLDERISRFRQAYNNRFVVIVREAAFGKTNTKYGIIDEKGNWIAEPELQIADFLRR